MRLLELSTENQKKVASLVEFASLPENRYKPTIADWVPGDRPEYTRHINTYRLVFTVTEMPDGTLYRHMTLSVPAGGKLPNPLVAFTLATWCGFTGGEVKNDVTLRPGADWGIGTGDDHVIFGQKVPAPHENITGS